MPETATPPVHPSWCTAHKSHSDGSDNWHESARVNVHGLEAYLSDGTLSGDVELYVTNYPHDGIPLDAAQAIAEGVLSLVREVQA